MDSVALFLFFLYSSNLFSSSSSGETLFLSPMLSSDKKISCANCHDPKNYFQDGKKIAEARNVKLLRNTPTLLNLKRYSTFSWDGRNVDLKSQILNPLLSHVEHNLNENNIKEIPNLINTDANTIEDVSNYLEDYLINLNFNKSKFEKFKSNETRLSRKELRGYKNFIELGCSRCHTEPNFTDNIFHKTLSMNLKLVRSEIDGKKLNTPDLGRGNVVDGVEYIGAFRTPSLFNVMKTPPYMHDGRFKTMNNVLDHYNSTSLLARKITKKEKNEIIAFLLTLTEKAEIYQ